ncbi:MAG: hypothetical protein L6Q99_15310 [Planctomycetes bacterium]|nr:hypothetical protein [Planctomycetota bacterium]
MIARIVERSCSAAASPTRPWTATLAYVGVAFALGFVLGIVRVLWVVPRVGERAAELTELPLMTSACAFVAQRLVERCGLRGRVALALRVGAVAWALLVTLELVVVVLVRGERVDEYVARRDPVAGVAYLGALALFAAWPAIWAWRSGRARWAMQRRNADTDARRSGP